MARLRARRSARAPSCGMKLTILSVAYPLAPVAPDTAGGAEQVLLQLDRALVDRGHTSLVIACAGSKIAGRLIEIPAASGDLGDAERSTAQRATLAAIRTALSRHSIDLVHMHGVDFHAYLPPPGVPVLATLHLPLHFYPPQALRPTRPQTFLHCVSDAQRRTAPADVLLLPAIENGVDVDLFEPRRKREFALFLGRICPEKGVHLAIEAAARAGIPLLVAGAVFGYESHRKYFRDEIAPKLSRRCRFIGPVGPERKRKLLAMARCVLIPSLVNETSSLVAREALAASAPVVAFARGALLDTVTDGQTGFLADTFAEFVAAIDRTGAIDPAVCRETAQRRFRREPMIESYLATYAKLAREAARFPVPA